jgi:hypothetical protein
MMFSPGAADAGSADALKKIGRSRDGYKSRKFLEFQ